MSLFMVLFKVIPYLMPFFKEMLIGKKTWSKAFKENRSKTLLALGVIASVIFNLVLVVKVGTLAFNYLELSRAKQEIDHKYIALQKSCVIPPLTPHPAIAIPALIPVTHKQEEPEEHVSAGRLTPKKRADRTAAIKAEFERMRKLEASEH